jgi:hypothetical protein
MLKVRFTGIQSTKRGLDASLRSEVKRLASEVFNEVTKRTPVDTGRAKAGWRQQVRDKSFTVENSVPYIGVLDKGRHMTNRGMRGSKQAPKGIVGPSLESIKRKN